MNSSDRKAHKAITNSLSDLKVSTSVVANALTKEPLAVQEQFATLAVSYFKTLALMQKSGIIPIHLADLARMGEFIHDEALVPYGLTGELDLTLMEREENHIYLQV